MTVMTNYGPGSFRRPGYFSDYGPGSQSTAPPVIVSDTFPPPDGSGDAALDDPTGSGWSTTGQEVFAPGPKNFYNQRPYVPPVYAPDGSQLPNRRRWGRGRGQRTQNGSTTTQYGGGTIFTRGSMATAIFGSQRSPIFRPGWGLDAVAQAQQWIDEQSAAATKVTPTTTTTAPAGGGYDPLALIRSGKSFGMQGLGFLPGMGVFPQGQIRNYNGGRIESVPSARPMARASYKNRQSPWFSLGLLPNGGALSPSVQAAQWIDSQRGNDQALMDRGMVDAKLPFRGAPALDTPADVRLGFAPAVRIRGPRTEVLAEQLAVPIATPDLAIFSGALPITPSLL